MAETKLLRDPRTMEDTPDNRAVNLNRLNNIARQLRRGHPPRRLAPLWEEKQQVLLEWFEHHSVTLSLDEHEYVLPQEKTNH